ncbi:MAG: ArnT family glycosyltransferase [Flavobacteriales bacterium]
MTKSFYPFLIFVLSIFILMCAPSLFTEGMFMDGLMYATVAKNLAHGEGSFWFLKFSDTYLSSFHEHPPLIFGLQSICFRIFGDSVFVERFFSFFTYIASGALMILIFRKITVDKFHHLAWFPLLLWIAVPLVPWGAMNNMLENGMLVFILASVLFYLKSVSKYRILFLALSSFMLFAAFLSKGFTGLFPLSLPFWFWCFDKEYPFKKFVADSLFLLGFLFLFFAVLFLFQKDSLPSLQAYFDIQVKNSLQNVVTVNSRFYIVGRLITELLISLGVVVLIFLLGRKNRSVAMEYKWLYIFLALGLSGVLPIMLSLKQNAHYLLCAFPFFSITMAILVLPYLAILIDKIKWRSLTYYLATFSLFICALGIAFSQIENYSRDEGMIHDVKMIANELPPHTVIFVEGNEFSNWALQAYFYRYASLNLSLDGLKFPEYKLIRKDSEIPQDYLEVPIPTKDYILLTKKK